MASHSQKGGLVRGHDKPIHGSCAIDPFQVIYPCKKLCMAITTKSWFSPLQQAVTTYNTFASLGIEYMCGDSGMFFGAPHWFAGSKPKSTRGRWEDPCGTHTGSPSAETTSKVLFFVHFSGHITATSHDLTRPNGSFLEGKWETLFQGNLGW